MFCRKQDTSSLFTSHQWSQTAFHVTEQTAAAGVCFNHSEQEEHRGGRVMGKKLIMKDIPEENLNISCFKLHIWTFGPSPISSLVWSEDVATSGWENCREAQCSNICEQWFIHLYIFSVLRRFLTSGAEAFSPSRRWLFLNKPWHYYSVTFCLSICWAPGDESGTSLRQIWVLSSETSALHIASPSAPD